MYFHLRLRPIVAVIAILLGFSFLPTSARANVYATNVRLDGGTTNLSVASGESVAISYVLNEPASLGVTVNITATNGLIRSLFFPPGQNGAARGLNQVVWDGKDSGASNPGGGTYSVSITAASSGYLDWTHISVNPYTPWEVWDGRGIAVDRNAASPYYGCVFVANASQGLDPDNVPADVQGILKFNADASPADGGIASGGSDGYTWTGNGTAPWKVEVSTDDWVYASDITSGGEVLRWDPTISSNSLATILRADNRPEGANLTGLAVSGRGTNAVLWMSDNLSTNGVEKWKLLAGGACVTNDLGTTVIGLGDSLTLTPVDVALDPSGNIYVIQSVIDSGSPEQRVFRFPAYDPATNGGVALTVADWAVGANDDTYGGASGIAVDPTGTYIAVSFLGVTGSGGLTINGNTKVLYATNGALVANLDLDADLGGSLTHDDTDCAWDAVGNVYYMDNFTGEWRAASPPGTNQATTVALATLQVQPPLVVPVQVIGITVATGMVTLVFTASTGDQASDFLVVASSTASGPYANAPGATVRALSPGVFQATVPSSGLLQFYQVLRGQAASTVQITGIAVSGGVVTLVFTGSTSDQAAAFTVLSSLTVPGPYNAASGVTLSDVGPGVFRATLPVSGPEQFYRIKR
jgi:hypothetical protein